MIREELLHPVSSHFPIAFLLILSITKLIQVFVMVKSPDSEFLKSMKSINAFLLFTGAISLLPTIFLGDMAFDIIKSDMKSLITAYKHEEMAHYTLYTYIVALIVEVSSYLKRMSKKEGLIVQSVLYLVIIIGNIFLIQAAHLGGEMVYEQGAAVNKTP